jgi:hypothetical protein
MTPVNYDLLTRQFQRFYYEREAQRGQRRMEAPLLKELSLILDAALSSNVAAAPIEAEPVGSQAVTPC